LPAALPLQVSVELPEPPVKVLGESEHDSLVELVVTARATVPLNPLIGATVMVEVPATPTVVETLVGLATTVKSWAWYVVVAECDRLPLVPVTVAR